MLLFKYGKYNLDTFHHMKLNTEVTTKFLKSIVTPDCDATPPPPHPLPPSPSFFMGYDMTWISHVMKWTSNI